MASRTHVTLIDDVDGSEASQTVRFGLDGTMYEIDLSDDNAMKMRAGIERFVDSARRTGGRSTTRAAGAVVKPGQPRKSTTVLHPTLTKLASDNATIRAWADANGIPCPKRGRVPESVKKAFAESH